MVKKIRRVRTFARTASKSMEKNLINNAKKLKNNPFLVLPKYDDNFSKKSFKKLSKSLEKINNYKDNIDKLEKFSNKKGLDAAVAGTILLTHTGKAPYLAVARLPIGEISYAQRGKADKFKLIAAQYFENPIFRLFGIRDIAIKKKIFIYSWDDQFFSTGKEPNPPIEFIKFIIKKFELNSDKNLCYCNHLSNEDINEKKVIDSPYIRIYWKSADIIIGFCEKCLKKSHNTIYDITKYTVGPDLTDDFSIDIISKFIEGKDIIFEADIINKNDYFSGKISDLNLIKTNILKREEKIRESDDKIFILNEKSYGNDYQSLIEDLNPNKYEKLGLELIMEKINEPVILKNVSSSKVLEKYWKDYGFKILNNILKDENLAKNFNKLDENPSDLLELVFNYKNRKKILSELPQYKELSTIAKFADKIAKLYKTYGENKILVELKNHPDNTKLKSLEYAFLLVINKGVENKWKFSNIEIESGEYLQKYAKNLLNSTKKDYHENLKKLLNASGSSENIDNCKI